jgi:AcrR family transcriptional regulator
LSRRERNKADKMRRIYATATRLFREQPFDQVTTLAVARAAGVSEGTLFNYVGSKAELLLLVTNDLVQTSVLPAAERQLRDMGSESTAVDRVCALLAPIVDLASAYPENFIAYHRELVYGNDGPYRDQAIATLIELDIRLGELIASEPGSRLRSELSPHEAGRIVWSAIYIDVLGMSLGAECVRDRHEVLRRYVNALVHGLLAPS